jgi:hypothetical protein
VCLEDGRESKDLAHTERVNFFCRFTQRERVIALYLQAYGQNYSVEIKQRGKKVTASHTKLVTHVRVRP